MDGIFKPVTKILASICVVVLVSVLLFPHLMDVNPPGFVNVLLKPAELAGNIIAPLIPHPNIGTPEHPIYEGTPIDILIGLLLVLATIGLYGVGTYLLLTLIGNLAGRFHQR